MNSRIALLALLFSAPIFCSETPVTTVVANSGVLSQVGEFVTSLVTTPVNFVFASVDKVANVTHLNTLISKVSCFSEGTNALIGRLTVLAATTALANEVYKRYIAQQEADADDADFDFTFETDDAEVGSN